MKIGILGGGESGIGAALLAKAHGNKPFVSDLGKIRSSYKNELEKNNIRFEESGHSFEILETQDLIVKSPGIPNSAVVIKNLNEVGIPVIGEIEYAFRYCEGHIVAITGTNGKTTVTNLTHHLLNSGGHEVVKGGNLGKSFARMVLESHDWYVVELSSFQLEDIVEFRPDIAAILNISPDHLDRYDNKMSNYLEAKARICINQKEEDYLFISNDDSIAEVTANCKAKVEIVEPNKNMTINNVYLKGEHNLINVTFAMKMAGAAKVNETDSIVALESFVNDNHRLQPVGRINEVLYVNDSKATNVDAVYHALRAFDVPIIWIVGGIDKGNDYSIINQEVEKGVSHIIALGVNNKKIQNYFKGKVKSITEVKSMKEAVKAAAKRASEGEVVLLSPACASFDLFENYRDRGDQFISEVWEILNDNS